MQAERIPLAKKQAYTEGLNALELSIECVLGFPGLVCAWGWVGYIIPGGKCARDWCT